MPTSDDALAIVEQREAGRCGEKGAEFRVDGLRNQESAPEVGLSGSIISRLPLGAQ